MDAISITDLLGVPTILTKRLGKDFVKAISELPKYD
jgi:hypothetical protein